MNKIMQNSQSREKLVSGDQFYQYPIIHSRGPMVGRYLNTLQRVLDNSLNDHPRTFAFRVDLRLPSYSFNYDNNRLMERFIASLKKKLKHNREMARKLNGWVPDTRVRYVWARETADAGQPHFHLMIFLNRDAFHQLGVFELGRDNMYNRLIQAWASALDLSVEQAVGLVHIPKNPMYVVNNKCEESRSAVFYRSSYLAKLESKVYGEGRHPFGGSRM